MIKGSLKIITLLVNLSLLVITVGSFVFSSGDKDAADYLLLAVIVFILLSNSYFLIHGDSNDSWLGLWFKRKALEEKDKIRKLEKE